MNAKILCSSILLVAGSLIAADSSPKDDLAAASKKLAASDGYSWTTTMEGGRFRGSTDGKIQKDGLASVTSTFGDNSTVVFVKGGKGAIKTDDGWKSLEDAAKDDGGGGFNPTRFLALRMQNFKSPADEAMETAGEAQSLSSSNSVISGDLTEDGAKKLLTFRRRGGNGDGGPEVKNAKGSVKFWVTDGVLTKYQVHVTGTINFNDQDNDVGKRTTTTEFKDVGKTTVTVPDEAKGKIST